MPTGPIGLSGASTAGALALFKSRHLGPLPEGPQGPLEKAPLEGPKKGPILSVKGAKNGPNPYLLKIFWGLKGPRAFFKKIPGEQSGPKARGRKKFSGRIGGGQRSKNWGNKDQQRKKIARSHVSHLGP
jgi:hypothetical protein